MKIIAFMLVSYITICCSNPYKEEGCLKEIAESLHGSSLALLYDEEPCNATDENASADIILIKLTACTGYYVGDYGKKKYYIVDDTIEILDGRYKVCKNDRLNFELIGTEFEMILQD